MGFFVDDQQLYLIFDPCDPLYAVSSVEPCIADIRAWLIKKFLLVNDTKTDALALIKVLAYITELKAQPN